MNLTDELNGVLVLVHPELTDDPAMMQGKVGMITGADLENDDVMVSLGKGKKALYSTSALLVLKTAEEIFEVLNDDTRKFSKANYKALFQAGLIQQFDLTEKMSKAMRGMSGDKVIRDLAMDTVENRLSYRQNQGYDQSSAR